MKDLFSSFKPDMQTSFIDKSLSGACGKKGTCARDLKVINTQNGFTFCNGMDPNSGQPLALRRSFFNAYRDHPDMNKVDAFICSHPPALCELYMPFNR